MPASTVARLVEGSGGPDGQDGAATAYLGDMSNAGQSPKPDHKEERSDDRSALSERARMFGRAVARLRAG